MRRAFEVRVWRTGYGKPFQAGVFDPRSGRMRTTIPKGLINSAPLHGGGVTPIGAGSTSSLPPVELNTAPFPRLRNFIRVRFFQDRHLVARSSTAFCPGGLIERVGDRGPANPTYPQTCSSTSPYVRGLVWGIDRDWADSPLDFGPNPKVRVAAGSYDVEAVIAPRYRRLFGIRRLAGTVRLAATVKDEREGPPPPLKRRSRHHARPRAAAGAKGVPTLADPPAGARPDLAALPAWGVSTTAAPNRDLLNFSATEWNAGPAPLDLEGFRKPGRGHMAAYEYFRNARGRVIGRHRAGSFEFDSRPGHHHWHIEQFARYSLVSRSGHRVLVSHKQSFCIAPTDLIDLTVPRADWLTSPVDLESSCGDPTALWIREALPTGWGDTYTQSVAGQAFDISDVPNGTYRIRVAVNPTGKLLERRRSNDVAYRDVRLGGTAGARTVKALPWHGLDP